MRKSGIKNVASTRGTVNTDDSIFTLRKAKCKNCLYFFESISSKIKVNSIQIKNYTISNIIVLLLFFKMIILFVFILILKSEIGK